MAKRRGNPKLRGADKTPTKGVDSIIRICACEHSRSEHLVDKCGFTMKCPGDGSVGGCKDKACTYLAGCVCIKGMNEV